MALIKNKSGLLKLHAERPSTAAVGNWGIIEVTQRLSEKLGLGSYVAARLFMGKKKVTKVVATAKSGTKGVSTGAGASAGNKTDYVGLSGKDDEATVRGQWEALRYALTCVVPVLYFSFYYGFDTFIMSRMIQCRIYSKIALKITFSYLV